MCRKFTAVQRLDRIKTKKVKKWLSHPLWIHAVANNVLTQGIK